ncbi:MAG: orotate phosphoribosyltransferase [Sutterellaceae bacterium]|nr:orotate phosphoribosyltransferase [Sutterellaceae bacterium]MDD7442129.1 orotate phosphoribosyltransferase [Sutterellaceae bacterium]MDY2869122.1 orotate phosphoribosyltransferase [Mesosutterella sp.]
MTELNANSGRHLIIKSSPIARDITAENLLSIGAVNFLLENPIRLKSGLVTPIYVDNRQLISHPEEWHDVIETMATCVEGLKTKVDCVAGVEGAGVSHSAALAYRMNIPNVYVRRSAKTYGDRSRLEGASVKGKRVLLIEDHISTGLSSLDAIQALRDEGATVTDCLSITNFDMPETERLFAKAGVATYAMLPFSFILEKAESMGMINTEQHQNLTDWLSTPWTWCMQHGFAVTGAEN